MFKSFIRQFRTHPLGMLLLLCGYMIGIFALSLGISTVVSSRQHFLDSNFGNPEHHANIKIEAKNEFTCNEVLPLLNTFNQDVEFHIYALTRLFHEGNTRFNYGIVPVTYTKKPEWQVPLISGRHFTSAEAVGDKRMAIVGKRISKELFPQGLTKDASMSIDGKSFKILGVVGDEKKETAWDSSVYVPLNSVKDLLINEPASKFLYFIRTNNKPAIEKAYSIFSNLKQNDSSILFNIESGTDQGNVQSGQVWNSIFLTVLISGIILVIAILNVMNLSLFWILDRRKEFAVKKALGATDSNIVIGVFMETLSISLVAALLAMLLQYILKISIHQITLKIGMTFDIGWINLLIAFAISIICGAIASLTPIRAVLKMHPINSLKAS